MVVANGQLTGARLQRLAPSKPADLAAPDANATTTPAARQPELDRLGLLPPFAAQVAAAVVVVGWLALSMPERMAAAYATMLLLFAVLARFVVKRRIQRGATTELGGQAAIIVLAACTFSLAGVLGQTILTPVIFILPAAVWLLAATAFGRPLADFGTLFVLVSVTGMTLLGLNDVAAPGIDRDVLLMLGIGELAAVGAARWHGARSGALLARTVSAASLEPAQNSLSGLLTQVQDELADCHDPLAIAQAGVRAISVACAPSYVAVVEIAASALVVPLVEDAARSVDPDLARRLVGLTQRTIGDGEPFWLVVDDTRSGDTLTLRRMGLDGLLIVPLAHLGQAIGAIQVAWERLPGPVALGEALTFVAEVGRRLTPDLAITRHIQELERGYFNAIANLSATLDDRDQYMRGHSRRVAKYAVWVADQLGIEEYQQRMLLHAAELHELGRAGVSEELLTRPGALSEAEWESIRQIPVFSAELVEPLSFVSDMRSVILHMNERWDGSGRPAGLSGEQIPLLSRILAVADAFDAMTSRRPYREPLAVRAALVQLWNERGSKFDPEIVELFARHPWADASGRLVIQ